jgi:ubiquinone biosynthesis monooxygenase Coq7
MSATTTSDAPVPSRPRLPGAGAAARRLAEILRVDHAGELGAVYIYRGQRAVLDARGGALPAQLAHMEAQEAVHLAAFDRLLPEHGVRPTLFTPLWRLAGFALGAGTALIGETAAHACTEAVETVIEGHYAGQIEELSETHPTLAAELSGFRDDELEHRQDAIDGGAHTAPAYPALSVAIRGICHLAIAISEKL